MDEVLDVHTFCSAETSPSRIWQTVIGIRALLEPRPLPHREIQKYRYRLMHVQDRSFSFAVTMQKAGVFKMDMRSRHCCYL